MSSNGDAPRHGFPTEASGALFERLARTMPGANTRTTTYFPPYPLAIERGAGAWIWDADGNGLIDLVNNYTSLVHGHAAPAITEAVVAQAPLGTVFAAPIAAQGDLAERLVDRVASVELVRFTNSGTEATMHAVRCARAATGRERIVKAHDGYHGSWDGLPSSITSTRGVTAGALADIDWIDFNDVAQLEAVMADHGDEVAAIVLEPVLGGFIIDGDPEFFAAARRLADRHGALLVLDEVVTFRLHREGYQDRLGVRADLTAFGKIIGGGLPVGAFGGRADLMALYDPRAATGVTHHGTFNGNALAMVAGVASLDLLGAGEIARINALGDRLAAGLRAIVADEGLDATVTSVGSLVQVHFGVRPPLRRAADADTSSPLLARLHHEALQDGVYLAPRGELNVTTAMDEALVDDVLSRLAAALGRMAASPAPLAG